MAEVTVRINGVKVLFFGQKPEINQDKGVVSIPLRGIFDTLGYKVDWDGSTQTITIANSKLKLTFVIGNKDYKVLSLIDFTERYPKSLPVAPYINNEGRTMLPLRGPLEAMGYRVECREDTVNIMTDAIGSVKMLSTTEVYIRNGGNAPEDRIKLLPSGITLTNVNPVQKYESDNNSWIKVYRNDNGEVGWFPIRDKSSEEEFLIIIPFGNGQDNVVVNNEDYRGLLILDLSQILAVNNLKHFYQQAGQEYGVPWQMLAAMHYRESKFLKGGPDNDNGKSEGPYQIKGKTYPLGPYTDEQFRNATNDAAINLIEKALGKDLTITDNVKFTFFAYNGSADTYKAQADNLGFTTEQAKNGEGSPYVMNRYDLKRDSTVEPTKSNNTWGQYKDDGIWPGTPGEKGYVYPANNDYGVFIIYKALGGI